MSAEYTIKEVLYELETPCLICGEGVPIWVTDTRPKICEKCKAAVLKMREQMDKEVEE